ncbi:MAG: histidine phosphatase family protein [Ilumatobacter sp.]|uniref:histidine phosphatase family protein n=1 Tax=Ilumatobacter sp. TaxID=1967498 RepID=UPI00329708CC
MSSDLHHRSQRIVLARHAETEWSISGRHTGRSDIALTQEGRDAAVQLGRRIAGHSFDRVISSPLERARSTALLADFPDPEIDDDLLEWDYGDYEGVTTADIRAERPDWELWTDGTPNGESPADVAARADALVADAVRICEGGGDAIVFGHGHMLTALAVRWIGLPIEHGKHFRISTGSIGVLRWKRENRVLDLWNDRSHLTRAFDDTP